MLFLVLYVATVVAICLVTVWSRPTVAKDDPPAAPTPPAARPADPQSLEGVLVVKLLAGDITTTQYRHALEGLAARDEDRHPLSAPPDAGV
ncbi:hypothetical protein ODJ79_14225 [Actinoplanes sp. KI2]|uniref:hypothetical protein n=1 Tax=Actinoplanes sp. KI2 TaxID=2983315 RepID=UPI0021D5C83F|nr:hypothetical protein [Actinoplanes sp. KI2]MCU7724879.1 hypothetical protein [Actinoplanes sp. KI2]